MASDRLDLLRRLTRATPHWALVKGEASALDGRGDVDSCAPADDWPAVAQAVSDWSRETGRGPVLACTHIPGTLVLAAVEPGSPATLAQVDVLDHRLLHGRPILRAGDLALDAAVGPSGFRRATPAAEALARLVLDEWSLRAPPAADTVEQLASLLRADAEQTLALAARLEPRLAEVLRALQEGCWPRAALARLELDGLTYALRRPRALLRRVAGARARRMCPLLAALRDERRVTADPVNRAHRDPARGAGYR